MKNRILISGICLFFLFVAFSYSLQSNEERDFEIIKRNVRAFLLKGFSPSLDNNIEKYIRDIKDDGSWKGLDYASQRRANWPTAIHTQRMREMAIAYNSPTSRFFKNPVLKEKILLAGDFWAENDLQCPNWYPNLITVPRNISKTMLMMEGHLSKERFDSWIRIAHRGTAEASGSNLAERASIQILTGCLEKNRDKVVEAVQKVSDDTKIQKNEGIQSDMSYLYHRKMYYPGGYGIVHVEMFGKLLFMLNDTRFQLPEEKINLFHDFILDGQRWIFYKDKIYYGAIGRGISRVGQSPGYFANIISYIGAIADAPGRRQKEVREFYEQCKRKNPILSGNRHFRISDVMIHRRENYHASVRMYSKNLRNSEVANEEGKLTNYIADGMNLIMVHGDEYEGVFPVWDWKRIPGITARYSSEPLPDNPRIPIDSTFVGGVSDGACGAAVFDFKREGLEVKKAWFFFDDQYLCLGSNINCASNTLLLTSINQCHLRGDVHVKDGSGTTKQAKGLYDLKGADWIYHDRIGYFFPEKSSDKINRKIIMKNDEQTGNWNRINGNLSNKEIKTDVFSIWINHGSKKSEFENSRYSYIVIPDTTPEKMERYGRNIPIRILENSEKIQAARDAQSNLTMAVFHQPAAIQISEGIHLSVNSKCLIMIRLEDKSFMIAASNPEPMESPLILEMNIPLTGDNCQWDETTRTTKITFDLPTGNYAGKSEILTATRR